MPRNNRNNLIADSKRKIGTKHVGLGNHSNNRIVSSPLFGPQNLSKMMMTMEKFTLSVFSSVFGYNSKIIVSVKAFSTHSAVSSQHTSIFFLSLFLIPTYIGFVWLCFASSFRKMAFVLSKRALSRIKFCIQSTEWDASSRFFICFFFSVYLALSLSLCERFLFVFCRSAFLFWYDLFQIIYISTHTIA